jgi:DNA ligase-1
MSAKALKQLDNTGDFVMQPKFDGCHMVVLLQADGCAQAYTATGEHVKSCDHIVKALIDTFGLPTADTFYCGEVWKFDTPFAEISGAFRRHSPQPDLLFVLYDVVGVKDSKLHSDEPYRERLKKLSGPLYAAGLVQCPSFPVEDVEDYANQLKAMGGYDGAILRKLSATYSVGRCRDAEVVKVKPLVELDLQVIDVKLAKGEKTGKNTAALLVRLAEGRKCFVATGLKQDEIDHITKFPDAWIGKIVAVEAMAWTEDGLLREPRYKGIRHDKAGADY